MQIVEHQHQRALQSRQRAPYTRNAFRPGGAAGARQRLEHIGREGLDLVNRCRDIPHEHHRVVVVSPVERDPRELTRIGLSPPRKERRLAVSSGGDDGREGHVCGAQPCD